MEREYRGDGVRSRTDAVGVSPPPPRLWESKNYGPQKYPQWLRALKGLKTRHDKLVESSSLYRQSLLIGKRVSNTSFKISQSLGGVHRRHRLPAAEEEGNARASRADGREQD